MTLAWLEAAIRIPVLKPPDPPPSPDVMAAIHSTWIASGILLQFFGRSWVEKNAATDARNKFLHGSPTTDLDIGFHVARKRALAELIFNLQDVPGLDDVLDRIGGGQIEPGYSELEVGKLLRRYGIKFWFVEKRGKKGADYDLEFLHPNGKICCGEVKSKAEKKTKLSKETILDSLRSALRQLPAQRPGVIFLKVPQNWYESPDIETVLNAAVAEFKSERVVDIIVWSNVISVSGDIVETNIPCVEFLNPRHGHDKTLSWALLTELADRSRHDPPGWIKLETLCKAMGQRFAT